MARGCACFRPTSRAAPSIQPRSPGWSGRTGSTCSAFRAHARARRAPARGRDGRGPAPCRTAPRSRCVGDRFDVAPAPRAAAAAITAAQPDRGGSHALVDAEARSVADRVGYARLVRPGFGAFEMIAVHPPPPTRGQYRRWRPDVRALPRAGEGGLPRVLAGDFNSTLDHSELRRLIDSGYRDAAASAESGLQGTWLSSGRLQWSPSTTCWRPSRGASPAPGCWTSPAAIIAPCWPSWHPRPGTDPTRVAPRAAAAGVESDRPGNRAR